nr:IgGFc-binding protein [Deltaproteobacteria bacterium]
TLTGPNNETITRTVAAGAVQALLPQPNGMPALIPDQSIQGTGEARKAYKLTSTLPIVAYQFNPLDNVNVFSNDASLLIPRAAFDTEYYVMSYATLDRRTPAPGNHPYYGYLSIVAWQDGTTVEVTPKAAVQASATQPAIAAGVATTFTLDAFEVLTLQAAVGGDLTGTKVKAVGTNQTFGVFGGHEATVFGETTPPNAQMTSGPCCADHIEEMMFPTSTWGKTFALVRSQARGANEPDMLRIMAQKPGTTITFQPAPIAGSCGTLGPGDFCEVKIQVDTAIAANEPILVGHYLQSAIWADPFFGGSVGEGDPDLSIAVPAEQYRNDYTILVPNAYAKNFLSISAPSQGAVLVDGVPVSMTPFANGTYRANRTMVAAGQHRITCPSGCGVEVYGYGSAVSYMFAGGLDLKQIVIQ